MKNTLISFFTMVIFFTGVCTGATGERVLRLKDGKIIAAREMTDELKKVDFVFVGESHDRIEDHQAQLDIIRALVKSGKPSAIGLEMFRAESQKQLDAWVQGKSTPDEFIPVYYDNWRMPWPLYRDILLYARDSRIPLIGLNVPKEITEHVSRSGFSSLNEEQRKKLPPNITCSVDREYMEFIKRAYGGHHPEESGSFRHFCEAQMVWDTAMAHHLVEYIKKNPGRTVVVIAGSGHAWKRAMPDQVARSSNHTFRVVLPETSGSIDPKTVTAEDADYLLLRK